MTTLSGKRLLLTGVADDRSIGFAVAQAAQRAGATILASAPPRDIDQAAAALAKLDTPVVPLILDVTDHEQLTRAREQIVTSVGGLDGALHAVAFAPRTALTSFTGVPSADVELAFRISVHSYVALGELLAEIAGPAGGSLVGLDFDSSRAWPLYNWMGVCKAALGAANRFLARDLGGRGVRCNLVSAGPLRTRAATAIPDFDVLLKTWDTHAPLPWDPDDAGPTADVACFLLSDAARAINGEIVHADSGVHAMATRLRRPDAST